MLTAVPDPSDANPDAVRWVDEKGIEIAWSKSKSWGLLLSPRRNEMTKEAESA